MSGKQFSRLKGRALLEKLNQHLLASLVLLGGCVCAALISAALAVLIHYAFILCSITAGCAIGGLLQYMRKLDQLRRQFMTGMYDPTDKQLFWHVENVRDKLMARLIQEKVCPWSSAACSVKTCPRSVCLCAAQAAALSEVGYNTDNKLKIVLNETDAST